MKVPECDIAFFLPNSCNRSRRSVALKLDSSSESDEDEDEDDEDNDLALGSGLLERGGAD